MSAAGDKVYLIWTQTDDMMFSRCTDGEKTFYPVVEISLYEQSGGTTAERYLFQLYPYIATFQVKDEPTSMGVLAGWFDSKEGNPDNTFEMSFVKSIDAGASFGKAKSVQFNGPSELPRDRLAIEDDVIYYTWYESEGELNQILAAAFSAEGLQTRIIMSEVYGFDPLPVLTTQNDSVNVLWFKGTEHGYLPDVEVNKSFS